jgi:hypothetical protein
MINGLLNVALGLLWLGYAAYMPRMRTRRSHKPFHPAFRWVYLVLGLAFIVFGLAKVL